MYEGLVNESPEVIRLKLHHQQGFNTDYETLFTMILIYPGIFLHQEMPLADVDVERRRESAGLPSDGVDFILYSYNEYIFEEKHFESVNALINLLKTELEKKNISYWIEIINRSCVNLPDNIKMLCQYFDIHSLTIEDIATLAPYIKLDLFHDQAALYLLMKILTWNDQHVEQQQISFYLKSSQNLLITFQEKSRDNNQSLFEKIRNRLRRTQQKNNEENSELNQNSRLRQFNVDYLFYCLLDDIIDRYMLVMDEIAIRIGQFDEKLMTDTQCRTLSTLYSIYHLKHDLLHLRILINPLKEILTRLERKTPDDHYVTFPRTDPSVRLGMKHHILRRQPKSIRHLMHNNPNKKSIYLNDYVYVYLNNLNNHIDQIIDSLEIQRESVSFLISFWMTLNGNETQEILQILMLISVLFMPCVLLTGMNSTNFNIQPQYEYQYSYYIALSLLTIMLIGMLIWYKVKRWI